MAVRAFPRVARRARTMLWSSVAAGKDCSKRARGRRFQPGYATRGALSQAAAFFSPAHKPHVQSDFRFRSGVSFGGNRLTGLELSKRSVKIGLTTIYWEGRETLSASHPSRCDEA